jgi:hypothetical protein
LPRLHLIVAYFLLVNLVFLKLLVLSQRLGLGKGGLRMAPEENLLEVLQVSHLYAVQNFQQYIFLT